MLLAIDIGNTDITCGVFQGDNVIQKFDIPTKDYNQRKLKKYLDKIKIGDTVICSVVPAMTKRLKKDLEKLTGRKAYIIGKQITVPIKNLYRYPGQVGQDRLVNAYAGFKLYGAPLIIVDFGTAITFDAISKRGEYLGGMILPGLRISLAALNQYTALLPKIKLSKPREFIGRDTENSMLSGIVYGFAGLTDELTKKIKNKIGKNARVIGTGGNINLIGKYCRSFTGIDKDLTLKGLKYAYNGK